MGCLPVEKKQDRPKIIDSLQECNFHSVKIPEVVEFKRYFNTNYPEKNRLTIDEYIIVTFNRFFLKYSIILKI